MLGGCETPPLTIKFRLTDGPSQECISASTGNETTDCSDMTMECAAVLSIRIVPPNEPDVPYVSVCEPVPTTMQRKLCAIAGIPLPQPKKPIPEQTLEVQMAVFPRDVITEGADGKLQCPIVEYGVNNLPVMLANCTSADTAMMCQQRPAVGGRAFYHPGDEETVIELGCTEFDQLNTCDAENRTDVFATVNEFDFPGTVDNLTAGRLFVSIGEPVPSGTPGSYVLDSSRTYPLPRDDMAFPPTWADTFDDLHLVSTYCIEVLEDAPMSTRTLTCRSPETIPDRIDASGTRLKPETLATILKAANLTTFPSKGIVVGIVLDSSFGPVAGASVTAPCQQLMSPDNCTIKYLSEDKQSFTTTATASNGIWISEDAPYGTIFSHLGSTSAFGGVVENKVTIVVLQESGVGG
jgi:hypothetical protein